MKDVNIGTCSIPVLHNVDTDTRSDADGIRAALVQQLSQPVRWAATVAKLAEGGVLSMAECGPGKVLTGLNRRISRDISSSALISMDAIEQTLENWS